jgi:hypothetical protein
MLFTAFGKYTIEKAKKNLLTLSSKLKLNEIKVIEIPTSKNNSMFSPSLTQLTFPPLSLVAFL